MKTVKLVRSMGMISNRIVFAIDELDELIELLQDTKDTLNADNN